MRKSFSKFEQGHISINAIRSRWKQPSTLEVNGTGQTTRETRLKFVYAAHSADAVQLYKNARFNYNTKLKFHMDFKMKEK